MSVSGVSLSCDCHTRNKSVGVVITHCSRHQDETEQCGSKGGHNLLDVGGKSVGGKSVKALPMFSTKVNVLPDVTQEGGFWTLFKLVPGSKEGSIAKGSIIVLP